MKRIVLILFVCALSCGPALAQGELPRVHERFDGTHCETTKSELDWLATRAGQEGFIVIIARLGTKEYSRKLNRERMQLLSEYLQNTRGVDAKRIVLGEGERVRGLGRVEIYLAGKLVMVFTINRNKDLARGCESA